MTLTKPDNLRFDLPLEGLADFCRRWKIERLEVFGSSLTNDFRPDSDVDFLYTAATDSRWGWDIVDLRDELSALVNRPVHLVSRHAIERSSNDIKRRLILDGAQVVYARR
jgi:predicted nucleotidyltransferase